MGLSGGVGSCPVAVVLARGQGSRPRLCRTYSHLPSAAPHPAAAPAPVAPVLVLFGYGPAEGGLARLDRVPAPPWLSASVTAAALAWSMVGQLSRFSPAIGWVLTADHAATPGGGTGFLVFATEVAK